MFTSGALDGVAVEQTHRATNTEADDGVGMLSVIRSILSRGSYGFHDVEALRSMVDEGKVVGDSQLALGVIRWMALQLTVKSEAVCQRNGADLH